MVNAFWLDRDVEQAAAWLVDAHVTSSVFECSMVLTTAVQLNGYPREEALYFTHADHPLTRWATASLANWERLRTYTEAAHEEWRYRWDHDADEFHGSWDVVETLDGEVVADLSWPNGGSSRETSGGPSEETSSGPNGNASDGSNGEENGETSLESTDPPQVTGDWSAPDYVDAYRYYYANEKRDLFEWSKDRTEPPWIEEYTVDDRSDPRDQG